MSEDTQPGTVVTVISATDVDIGDFGFGLPSQLFSLARVFSILRTDSRYSLSLSLSLDSFLSNSSPVIIFVKYKLR